MKKAGAKADAAFVVPDKVCLLLENKYFDAQLTDRQKFLYLNHFMHFYDNCNLKFSEHRLIFLVDEKSINGRRLENLFNEDYAIPFQGLEKSHLKNVRQIGKAQVQGDGWTAFNFVASYKQNVPTSLIVSVKIVRINSEEIETIIR